MSKFQVVYFGPRGGEIHNLHRKRDERKVRLYFTSECDKCIVVNLSSLLYVVNATVNK